LVSSGAAAAHALGLTTQMPEQQIYLSRSRSQKRYVFGKQQVTIGTAAAWNFLLADRPAGQAIRWRFVAEFWFALSAEDQNEALAVAAAESGWPAFLLEKDIWVVWALQILGTDQQLLHSHTFQGGTSLSKAHGLIDRFSEDVDLTVNIQHLWPDVDLAPAVNPSQAERRRKAADSKLKQWVS
jgi:hypothetical protein